VWGTYEALKDVMDLDVVFWGNAQGPASKVTCQHGPPECRVQMVYACSKNLYPGVDNYLPFAHCVDDTLIKMFPKGLPEGTVNMTLANSVMTQCAKTVGHDYAKLDACATGADGVKYIGEEMAKTPAHKGVPFWQIGDGAVTYPDQTNKEDLLKLVCDALTGTKPAACASPLVVTTSKDLSEASFDSMSCEAQSSSTVVV